MAKEVAYVHYRGFTLTVSITYANERVRIGQYRLNCIIPVGLVIEHHFTKLW